MTDALQLVMAGLSLEPLSPSYLPSRVSYSDAEYDQGRTDECTQTDPDNTVVHLTGCPFLSPCLMCFQAGNAVVHVWAYASWLRRIEVSPAISESVVAAYLFFALVGLLFLPGVACLPLIATITRQVSAQRAHALRCGSVFSLAAVHTLPLLYLDLHIYVANGLDLSGDVVWQACALFMSIATGLGLPWALYLDCCVERVHRLGVHYAATTV